MRVSSHIALHRFPDRVEIFIRPYAGKWIAFFAFTMAVLAIADIILSHEEMNHLVTTVIVWSAPIFALVLYLSWLVWGKQEIVILKDNIKEVLKIGPWVLRSSRAIQREHLVAARYMEVKRSFRRSRFVSRRLVLEGTDGISIKTIALLDESTALHLCEELGMPMNVIHLGS